MACASIASTSYSLASSRRTGCRPQASPVPWLPAYRGRGGAARAPPGRCPASVRDSFDELSQEFSEYGDPARMERMKKHLELAWRINKLKRPQKCDCCHGTGEKECDWCHGTGVMTVGDQVFLRGSSGGSQCPVCKAKGYVACDHCRGTGSRAQWLGAEGAQGTPK